MRKPVDFIGGSVLLVTVMVMGTATLVGFIGLAQASISRIQDADNTIKAYNRRTYVYGCAEEVLLQWQKNPNWNSPSINTGLATCSLTITNPTANERKAEVRWNDGTYYFGVDVTLDIVTNEITDLQINL
jgi:hypothetical protein